VFVVTSFRTIHLIVTMVFTANQITTFFEDPTQMAIPNATQAQLVNEGIATVDDLGEFDDEHLKQIAENLRRPSGRVPVDPAAPDGPTMPTPPFVFGAKSLNRLKAAADLVRYYETIGSDLTAGKHVMGPHHHQAFQRPLEIVDGTEEKGSSRDIQDHPWTTSR
jgi:hypothetical protein